MIIAFADSTGAPEQTTQKARIQGIVYIIMLDKMLPVRPYKNDVNSLTYSRNSNIPFCRRFCGTGKQDVSLMQKCKIKLT